MEDSILVNYYSIDNKNYIVINEIDYDNKHYVYLVNEDNNKDILIRYVEGDSLIPVETEEELMKVFNLLIKKM